LYQARNYALRALRLRHPEEYQSLLAKEQKRLGLEIDPTYQTRRLENLKPG
jgi:hypothetical protein